MIIDLPDTTVSKISRALVSVREEGGAVALGRVLTLVIVTREAAMEEAIDAANDASREHPMRVIVLMINADDDEEPRLDAQIRVGGDAGASEVVTLHAHGEAGDSNLESLVTGLLLSDAPVVVWWPNQTPEHVSETSIGRIAQRRITDAATKSDPAAPLSRRTSAVRREELGLRSPWLCSQSQLSDRQSTQAEKPRVACPTSKHVLLHIICLVNLRNLFECI